MTEGQNETPGSSDDREQRRRWKFEYQLELRKVLAEDNRGELV